MSEYELYHASTRKHKYIKKIGNRYFYSQQEIAAYLKGKKSDVTFEKNTYDNPDGKVNDYRVDFNKHDGGWSDGIGVRTGNKKIQVYNTTNKKYWKDNETYTVKKRGRLTSEYAEDGSTHTLNLERKKKRRKNGSNTVKKQAKKNLKSMKSQVSKGKKKMHKIYKEWINPDVTVSFDEAKIH